MREDDQRLQGLLYRAQPGLLRESIAGQQGGGITTLEDKSFGCVVPTLKIASNDTLATNKPNWIDWNAMSHPEVEAFAEMILRVASGETRTKNELSGAQGIAIFKDGVTL